MQIVAPVLAYIIPLFLPIVIQHSQTVSVRILYSSERQALWLHTAGQIIHHNRSYILRRVLPNIVGNTTKWRRACVRDVREAVGRDFLHVQSHKCTEKKCMRFTLRTNERETSSIVRWKQTQTSILRWKFKAMWYPMALENTVFVVICSSIY